MISKKSLVTFVELPPTQFGILNGNASYDVYSKFKLPPRALPTLSAILKRDGWENIQMIHPQFHGRNGKLTVDNLKRIIKSDVLLLSAITRTSPQTIALAKRYKKDNPKGIIIAGGMDPSYRTKDWMNYVDIVVKGEAEETLSELMKQLTQDPASLEDIRGITFKENGTIIETPKRLPLSEKRLGEMPIPYYDEAIAKGSNVGVVEEERGCPFNCDFCAVTLTYGNAIRFRSNQQIIDEVKQLHEKKMDKYIFFSGDNLSGKPKRAIDMLESLINSGVQYNSITAQVTASAANDDELLKIMRKAKIDNLCVGFESITSDSLKDMHKPFSADQNDLAAKKFREYGFWVHAMMITGTDADTPKTLRENLGWAKKNVDSLQFFIKTPLPGTPFWDKIEKEERFLTKDFSLYDCQHCVVRPIHFTPYQLQKMVIDGYREFYSTKSVFFDRLRKTANPMAMLVIWAYTTFGGLKGIIDSPQSRKHLEFLKSVS